MMLFEFNCRMLHHLIQVPPMSSFRGKQMLLWTWCYSTCLLLSKDHNRSDSTKAMTKHANRSLNSDNLADLTSDLSVPLYNHISLWQLNFSRRWPFVVRNSWTRFMRDIRVSQHAGRARHAVPLVAWPLQGPWKTNLNLCQMLQSSKAKKSACDSITDPQVAWQVVGTDLFEWNQETFLLIVDYYSR